ncbi:hypothetical protein [Leptospira wolffii]|uniref:hypothetical protein n=1 Tax=Leptospira wolffii TaxID=409998 RepID=UPI0002FC2717|nr:hypothetical protein [Leptospira wolffii]EPG64145.1 putative lipoprotein [Leptospira wolffii serovar Khorat str. Khorat-H2]
MRVLNDRSFWILCAIPILLSCSVLTKSQLSIPKESHTGKKNAVILLCAGENHFLFSRSNWTREKILQADLLENLRSQGGYDFLDYIVLENVSDAEILLGEFTERYHARVMRILEKSNRSLDPNTDLILFYIDTKDPNPFGFGSALYQIGSVISLGILPIIETYTSQVKIRFIGREYASKIFSKSYSKVTFDWLLLLNIGEISGPFWRDYVIADSVRSAFDSGTWEERSYLVSKGRWTEVGRVSKIFPDGTVYIRYGRNGILHTQKLYFYGRNERNPISIQKIEYTHAVGRLLFNVWPDNGEAVYNRVDR